MHESGHGDLRAGIADASSTVCRWARRFRWAFTNRNRGCGRIWSAAAGRSGRTSIPRPNSYFPAALGDVSLDAFHFAINDVRPSLIRIEADEATYNLHILIRFELERAMLDGTLRAADLPEAWNEKYQQYLGITPPDNRSGVLQDVHWSAGLIGYFPTYSLGNLYAAQFFSQAESRPGRSGRSVRPGRFSAAVRLAA